MLKWTRVDRVSDLRGGALELQQHQRTGTLQDVEVKQKRLLPVVWEQQNKSMTWSISPAKCLKNSWYGGHFRDYSMRIRLILSGDSLQRCSGLSAELPPAVCGVDHFPGVTLRPSCMEKYSETFRNKANIWSAGTYSAKRTTHHQIFQNTTEKLQNMCFMFYHHHFSFSLY